MFTQQKNTSNNYLGWILVAATNEDNLTDAGALVKLRNDNWDDKAGANTGCVNNFIWDTFNADMNGSTVDMAVSYNSGTLTMTSGITTTSNKHYSYSYTKAIDGTPSTIAICLSVNSAYLTITTSKYYAPSGEPIVFNATLDHTAGAQWGSNTGASTVDAEKEHYNNDAANAWAGCAYAKFSFDAIPDGVSITAASITYSVKQGGSYGRNDIIYYMAKDFDLDWATFAGQTGTDLRYTSNRGGTAVAAAATGGTGDRLNLSQSVMNAVKTIYEDGQKYIIFQWTGNAGSADLYGKASANKPSMSITYTSSATASYNVNYLKADGTVIKSATIHDAVPVGSVVEPSDAEKATFVYDGKKYVYNANGICVIDGDGTNNLNIYFDEYNPISYTVNAVDADDNLLYKIAEGETFLNENVTVAFDAFYLKNDGNLLQADRIDDSKKQYRYTFNVDEDGKVVTVTYKNTSYSNIIFYKEAEDVATLTEVSSGNVPVRCSGGKGAYAASDAVITTLGPGKYKLSSFAWGTTGTNLNIYAGEILIKTFSTASSTLSITTSDEFTLTTSTDIIFKQGGNAGGSPKVLDFFFIEQTAVGVTTTAAGKGFATLYTDMALDFSGVDGLSAYTATCDGSTVTLTKVNDVPANTGVVLMSEINDANTDYAIPVAESSSTAKGVLTGNASEATAYNGVTGHDIYMLALNGEGKVQFTKVTSGEIAAGKAYLPVANGGSVKAFNVVFAGNEETAISETAEKTEATESLFDLSGRRVNKAQKGIFIANGKKVVIK